MVKEVIALWGKAKVGKSQTLIKVYKRLIAKYPGAILESGNPETNVDIKVILTINNIKVGIESQGDPPGKRLAKSLKLFVDKKCNIIVCTTRSKGTTINLVDKLEKHGYNNTWFHKYREQSVSEQESSAKMAGKIIRELEKIGL